MKKKLLWFVFGFAVSWAIWSSIAYSRSRPRDYTAKWSTFDKSMVGDDMAWLRHARGVEMGSYSFFTPAEKTNASLYVYCREKHFPGAVFIDSGKRGQPNLIILADAEYKSITVTDTNGQAIFDSYSVSTGIKSNSLDLSDNNFNGTFDMQLGPGRRMLVNIASEWRELIRTNHNQYVQLGGELKRVKAENGVWHVLNGE